MTSLATQPVDEPDLLSLIADTWTVNRRPFADAFRDACRYEADTHMGWVNPNRIRAKLLDHPQYNPRQLSALWCSSCGRDGFMVKTDRLVPIVGEGSKGNGNKSVPMRRWVG